MWQIQTMQPDLSRRTALKRLSAGALLTAGLWPGALRASNFRPDGKFRFIAVNDLHYMTPECGEWLNFVASKMRRHPNVDFALVSGDLTEHGELKHLQAVKSILRELDMPTYVQIGNHDYSKDNKSTNYTRTFPRRLNYWFSHEGWQFVSLDSSEGLKYEKTKIQPDTFEWVRSNLNNWNKSRPMIIFTHFPLAAGVRYRPQNADDLLDLFREHNLVTTYSGHFHSLTHKQKNATDLWTNRCCALKRHNHDGTKQKGYLLCDVAEGKITTRFFEVAS